MIDARMFIPTKAFLTKGVGRHKEKLTSFEMALRDAHLANFNLVRVSSIFPPHCELVDREEGMSMLRPGQVVFAVIAESATNEPSRLVAASIGVAMPADPSHHGYISEHHSYGQSESVSGEYAEDLAASMLATVLGVPFEADQAWDERREQWLLSGEIVRTMNVTSTAECGADGRWTTVVSAVAFAAGLLSFLSPCVLPLIPSYVGFLTGMSVEEVERRRGTAVLHGLWFVAGFTLVFIILGAAASALGVLLRDYQQWLGRAGGVLLILFGLYLLGVLRPAFLMRERRIELARKPIGYVGSGVVGFTFGAAWTPCIGPILGGILTLAATQTGLARGVMLLAVYAAGLAVPFLLTALALDRFLIWFQRFRPYIMWVDRIAGALLVVLGILLVTDTFTVLAGYLQGLTPDSLRRRL